MVALSVALAMVKSSAVGVRVTRTSAWAAALAHSKAASNVRLSCLIIFLIVILLKIYASSRNVSCLSLFKYLKCCCKDAKKCYQNSNNIVETFFTGVDYHTFLITIRYCTNENVLNTERRRRLTLSIPTLRRAKARRMWGLYPRDAPERRRCSTTATWFSLKAIVRALEHLRRSGSTSLRKNPRYKALSHFLPWG